MKEIEVNKKTKHESYLTSFALPPNSSFNIPAPKKNPKKRIQKRQMQQKSLLKIQETKVKHFSFFFYFTHHTEI